MSTTGWDSWEIHLRGVPFQAVTRLGPLVRDDAGRLDSELVSELVDCLAECYRRGVVRGAEAPYEEVAQAWAAHNAEVLSCLLECTVRLVANLPAGLDRLDTLLSLLIATDRYARHLAHESDEALWNPQRHYKPWAIAEAAALEDCAYCCNDTFFTCACALTSLWEDLRDDMRWDVERQNLFQLMNDVCCSATYGSYIEQYLSPAALALSDEFVRREYAREVARDAVAMVDATLDRRVAWLIGIRADAFGHFRADLQRFMRGDHRDTWPDTWGEHYSWRAVGGEIACEVYEIDPWNIRSALEWGANFEGWDELLVCYLRFRELVAEQGYPPYWVFDLLAG